MRFTTTVYAAILSLIVTSLSAHTQELRRFVEPKFGTSALVPSNWRSEPINQAGVNGRYFYSQDGETWLAVFGRAVAPGVNARTSATAPDETVTYSADGVRWFVRSGLRQDRIFYRRALFSCRGRVAHLIAFEYPASRKREHDRLVTVVSRSLNSRGAVC
jgi:hypothetical protein